MGGGGRTPWLALAGSASVGAGHVCLQLALDPGLVYEAGTRDYVELYHRADAPVRLQIDFVKCTRALAGGPVGHNYASFIVIFANGPLVGSSGGLRG